MGRVIVVGSVNMDVVARVPRLPRPGETLAGSDLHLLPGGKGANQAVAAARAGAAVRLLGALGADDTSGRLAAFLAAEGLDPADLVRVAGPSGTALILLDDTGENVIVIIAGANAAVDGGRVAALDLTAADVLLLQNEIPEPANLAAARATAAAGGRSILNLAPYRATGRELLAAVDYLICNESEYARLAGTDVSTVDDVRAALAGPGGDIVVTLGAAGLLARLGGEVVAVPAYRVPVRDTTGAGDCFCGAFGAALAAGLAAEPALRYATAAAALAVQRLGAAPAMPYRAEIEAQLQIVT